MAVIVGKDGKVRQFNVDRGSPPFIPDVRPSAIEQPPHLTDIMGQPHMLSYITPDEATLLMEQGGMGIEGPMGIPAFPPGDSVYDPMPSPPTPPSNDDDDDGPGFDPSAPPDSGGYAPPTPPSGGENDDDSVYDPMPSPPTPPSGGENDSVYDPMPSPPTPPRRPSPPPPNDDDPMPSPPTPPSTPRPPTDGGGQENVTRPPKKPDIPPVTDPDTGGGDTGGGNTTPTNPTDPDPTKPDDEYGIDYNNDNNISYAEVLRDRMDGGGPRKSGVLGGTGIIGAGLGLASNIAADIGMGYRTFGVGFDDMEQKLVDAGYSREDAASYVQRTKDTMERNRIAAATGARDDDDDSRFVAPPADPCPNGYIMDPESQVCVIDPVATPEKPKIPAPPPPPPPPPLSEYIDYTPPVGGGGFLQPGSEDISFMRRSGQFAAGGQVGVGSLPAYSDFFRYK